MYCCGGRSSRLDSDLGQPFLTPKFPATFPPCHPPPTSPSHSSAAVLAGCGPSRCLARRGVLTRGSARAYPRPCAPAGSAYQNTCLQTKLQQEQPSDAARSSSPVFSYLKDAWFSVVDNIVIIIDFQDNKIVFSKYTIKYCLYVFVVVDCIAHHIIYRYCFNVLFNVIVHCYCPWFLYIVYCLTF